MRKIDLCQIALFHQHNTGEMATTVGRKIPFPLPLKKNAPDPAPVVAAQSAYEKGVLFIDHYRPRTLDEFIGQDKAVAGLRALAHSGQFSATPHLILQGAAGSGKKSLCRAYLAERFGPAAYALHQRVVTQSYPNKEIELQVVQSPHHYQIDPSAHGVYDRLIIQDFIKGMAEYQTVDNSHRVIVIHNADNLTHEAQQSLRRTLEKYIQTCRFIFICENLGNVIPALQSRCVLIRVATPGEEDLRAILERVVAGEKLHLPETLQHKLLQYNPGQINTLLNQLETLVHKYGRKLPANIKLHEFAETQSYYVTILNQLGQLSELNRLLKVREQLYDLLVHCVEPTEIISRLARLALTVIPDQAVQLEVVQIAADHDHQIRLGSKPIYHLESFVVNLMIILKHWTMRGGAPASVITTSAQRDERVRKSPAHEKGVAPTGRQEPDVRPRALDDRPVMAPVVNVVPPSADRPVVEIRPKTRAFPASRCNLVTKKIPLSRR